MKLAPWGRPVIILDQLTNQLEDQLLTQMSIVLFLKLNLVLNNFRDDSNLVLLIDELERTDHEI